ANMFPCWSPAGFRKFPVWDPVIFVSLCQRRIPKDTHLMLGALQQTTQQIIDVPAGTDDQQSGIFGQSGVKIIREPRPSLIEGQFGIGLGTAFERIVNDAQIEAEASNSAFHRDIAE